MKAILTVLQILCIKILQEVFFRATSLVMFPIAYFFRDYIRANLRNKYTSLFVERTWTDTQYIEVPKFSLWENILFLFWLYLDDSPAKDSFYNDLPSYDSSDTRRYYPTQWIYDNKTLRDIWFSFIRNNSVNYFSWYRTGGWTDEVECVAGKFDSRIDKNDDNSYYVAGWYVIKVKHVNGKTYPFFTFIGEIFGRKIGMWLGRSSGSGRYSISIRG